ncbi:MAG TPA: phosphoenolpyruvate carboxylase [Nitrososphaerales archaeon]|nr:phosphoenolpyruvate carboxylase [Nitrososphaerales archaeon]
MVEEKRFIPKTMTTQHPDNANTPPWSSQTNGVIEGETELDEAYIAYSKLACSEVMWDSEGKDVDTNVVRKLLSKYSDYFMDNVFGRDIFLTYRIPNPLVEKAERKIVTQTLQSIPLQSDVASAFYERETVPVSSVILPFTTKGAELLWLDRCYGRAIAGIEDISLGGTMKVKDWVGGFLPKRLEAIPLVEDAASLSSIDRIVMEYISAVKPRVMRVFIARSDPALNYGLITAVLLSKVALSRLSKVQKKTGVRLNPILGVGTMPFRGHLNPENIENFLAEYRGLSTVTIQSAFRYDYPAESVERGIATLNQQLPNGELADMDEDQERLIEGAMKKLIPVFQARVEILAPMINYVASFIPTRRARKLHIGLFGYSRRVKGVTMPRAIPFAAAFYSLGVPPEFIGAQALRSLTDKELEAVKRTYKGIQFDYRVAGSLVSWETVHLLVDKYDVMAKITQMNKEKLKNALRYVMTDLSTVEETLSLPLGPSDNRSKKHENFVNTFMMSAMDGERSSASNAFIEAAKLRRCLG